MYLTLTPPLLGVARPLSPAVDLFIGGGELLALREDVNPREGRVT